MELEHLEGESSNYVALASYYKKNGDLDRARLIAEQRLGNCKDDLTELFIFVLTDAREKGDTNSYKKWYSSAKRRRLI